jgi:hypothetical protein
MTQNLVVFKNQSETIIGELISRTENNVQVKNPASIFIQPTQTGQLTVQVFPVFFGELLDSSKRSEGTVWTYSLIGGGIGEDIALDEKLISQYTKIFNPSPIIVPESSNKIVKLFDD